MLSKLSLIGFALALLLAPVGVAATDPPAAEPSPQALFVESLWEFEPVIEGTEVVHDFVVKNQGQTPLKILNVKTS